MQITVTGAARVSLTPERATVHVTAGFEGEDRAQVVASTTALVTRLTEDVDRLRAGDDAPVTWAAVLPMTTRSWVPYVEGGEQTPRFAASCELRVRFRDLAELSRAGVRWGEQEGVRLESVEWSLTDATAQDRRDELLRRAVQDARARGLVIAQAAGFTEAELVEVADQGMLAGGAPAPMPTATMARSFGGGRDGGIDLRPEDIVLETVLDARMRAV